MYWRQKGQFYVDTEARRDNLITLINNFLDTVETSSRVVRADGTTLITVIVDYPNEADSQTVWDACDNYRTSGFIVSGFMGYGRINDDGSSVTLGRFDIP